ncbi:lytic transglycosylase domain-containing protein [Asaia spathodeae]|uniref:Lytic transglycosylase domain-containing protein n=2 Tax=Asaia spathodeae TaxID=657016 RepID=A0ABX2PAM0_9PROT
MGIQEGWMPILERAGFEAQAIRNNACWNIIAAAWIISGSSTGVRHSPHSPYLPQNPLTQLSGELSACVANAARLNRIPEGIFRAVLMTEGGKNGLAHRNQNGSEDLGVAQINTRWLPVLSSQGITRERLMNDGCLNVSVGAWILGRELANADNTDTNDMWRRIGNYNSHTPSKNIAYQNKVWTNLQRISQ